MKKFLLLAAFLFPLATFAQISGGVGSFNAGITTNAGLANLNTLLLANGYTSIGSPSVFTGGSGYFIWRNIVLGGEGYGFGRGDASALSTVRNFSGGYALLQAGYVVVSGRKFLLYPTLGAGFGTLQVNVRERANNSTQFNTVLADPGRGTDLRFASPVFKLAVDFDYYFRAREDGAGGLLLGLTAGYTYSPSSTAWYAYTDRLAPGPATTLTGFYAGLKIGGGSWHRRATNGGTESK